ncbi:uncharacterized protein LOC135820983 [Sycon ciliatum]|uniref:uncharacterized protein LOC135820983 n=1 Tax=Sycon ciliatum TaxID=27933 RepID=UPI0031F66FC1
MATLSAPTSPSKGFGLSGLQQATNFPAVRRRSRKDRFVAFLSGSRRHSQLHEQQQQPDRQQGDLTGLRGRYYDADVTLETKKASLPRFGRSNTDSQLQRWNDPPPATAAATAAIATSQQQQQQLQQKTGHDISGDSSAVNVVNATRSSVSKLETDHQQQQGHRQYQEQDQQGQELCEAELTSGSSVTNIDGKMGLGAKFKLRRKSSKRLDGADSKSQRQSMVQDVGSGERRESDELQCKPATASNTNLSTGAVSATSSTDQQLQHQSTAETDLQAKHAQLELSDISLNSGDGNKGPYHQQGPHSKMRLVGDKDQRKPGGAPSSMGDITSTVSGELSPNKEVGFKTSAASRIRRSLRFRRNTVGGGGTRSKGGGSSSSSAPSTPKTKDSKRTGSLSSAGPGSYNAHSGAEPGYNTSATGSSDTAAVTGNNKLQNRDVTILPGTFRKVSGIRDPRLVNGLAVGDDVCDGVASAPTSRSHSRAGAYERTVDIRRQSGKPFGFKFIFELPRKASSASQLYGDEIDHEPSAYVTHIERNTMIERQCLLEVGDRILTINGVSVSSARRAQDLREMVQTSDQLVMNVRSACTSTPVRTAGSGKPLLRDNTQHSLRSDSGTPSEYEYSPQPRLKHGVGTGYTPGELAQKGMGDDLKEQLSQAISRRSDGDGGDGGGGDQEVVEDIDDDAYNTATQGTGKEVGSEAETPSSKSLSTELTDDPAPLIESKPGTEGEAPQLVACMDAIMEDTSLTEDARKKAIAEKLSTQLDLPFLLEPASFMGFEAEEEDDRTPADPVKARCSLSERMAHSVLSLLSSEDDDEIFAEVHGDAVLSDARRGRATTTTQQQRRDNQQQQSVAPVDGFMLVRLLDGSGFTSADSSHLYCVLDIGGNNTAARSSSLQAAGGNTVNWDEDFDINLECTRQLVISVYAISPGKDILRAQTALHLQPLFSSARLRRLRLLLPTGGILRLKLAYADRTALLRRLPSASQFGTFGMKLGQVVMRERVTVPLIVQKCIYEIDRRGLRHVGLYRVNGSSKKKRALRQSFEANSRTAMLSEEHVPDVNVIVGLLKEYLRELPEPLLTHALYSDLIDAVKPPDKQQDYLPEEEIRRRKRLLSVLARLPQAEMDTCRMLFSHLHRVLQNSAHNQMTAHNLAICLGPVLMMPSPQSPKKVPQLVASDVNAQIGVIFHILIFNWPDNMD